MASINARSGSLQVDFRYKGQRCREQTRYADTPANRKKLEFRAYGSRNIAGNILVQELLPKEQQSRVL